MSVYFFVYGTLLSGEGAGQLIDQFGDDVVRYDAHIDDRSFVLTTPPHGGFPALVPIPKQVMPQFNQQLPRDRVIKGEIISADESIAEELQEALDRYEGYPDLYDRMFVICTMTKHGHNVDAQAYYMPYSEGMIDEGFTIIKSQSWRDREDTMTFEEVMEAYDPEKAEQPMPYAKLAARAPRRRAGGVFERVMVDYAENAARQHLDEFFEE